MTATKHRLLWLAAAGGVLLFFIGRAWQAPRAAAAFAIITVTTTADTVATDGQCSLREAIQAANTNAAVNECAAGAAGLDTINFNIGAGTPTINVTSALPTVSQPLVINGNTGGATRVELNGTGAGAGVNGLNVTAGGSTLQALVINRFGGSGISIATAGGNTIRNCLIGTNAAGTAAAANGGSGVNINNVPNNLIGGTTAAERNIISGNNGAVTISGASASGNLIQGNYIGTDAAGMVGITNGNLGITLVQAPNNTIGGTTPGAGNVISGNGAFAGIRLDGSGGGMTGNVIQGNLIGLNAAGTAALPNGGTGVELFDFGTGGPTNTLIGGTTAAARNVIAGNGNMGITISGATVANNTVQGNFIGTDVTGTVDLGNTNNGIFIRVGAHDNLIGGTTAAARNVISGNNTNGIEINAAATTANLIQGNFIGTNATGTAALPNNSSGVLINGAANNTIGGSAAARNVLSGNNTGVLITGASAINNTLLGNFIGPNAAGTAVLPNGSRGVNVDGAPNNLIGGTAPGEGNVISGNLIGGVFINGAAATGVQVRGNLIGTNAAGTAALGNSNNGVTIQEGDNNIIGGTAVGAGNVISGNGDGIVLTINADNNQIIGNFIGTNKDGNAAIGNTVGIQVQNSVGNVIGGTTPAARNVISGNTNGVSLAAAGSNNNQVQGNFIGTDVSGNNGIGNGIGVTISFSGPNTIGGTLPNTGNVIAFNTQRGIEVINSVGNRLLGNRIFANGELGIDLRVLGDSGVTPNDVGDGDTGPNNLQNFPLVTSVASAGGNTTLRGTLNSTANTVFRLEFFANTTCDTSGNGEGQFFLGFTDVTTDGGGNASFNVTVPGTVLASQAVTATATDAAGNTSEFSPCACNFVFAPSAVTLTAPAGASGFSFTNGGCPWTVTSAAPWLTITSAASGAGNGSVMFSYTANPSGDLRTGLINVAGNSYLVTQRGTSGLVLEETFDGPFPPPGWTVADGGTGNGRWTKNTENPCPIAPALNPPPPPFTSSFAAVDAKCPGPSDVMDEYLITPPFNPAGLGTVYVEFFNIFKASGTPNIGDVDVTTNGGATWTNVLRLQGQDFGIPTPETRTIDLTPFLAGNPPSLQARLHYYGVSSPAPRPGSPEGGAEVFWAVDFTIYGFGLSALMATAPPSGGTGSVNVFAAPGRAWTAVSNAPWLSITAGASGTGNGVVTYAVMPNPGPNARTGTATIAQQTLTITQPFQVEFEADVAPRSNGNGTVNVADYVQVGRFAIGLDTAANGSEFQRADCAPRGTLGNGQITVADYVQAGRYAIGLDPPTTAGGPAMPSAMPVEDAFAWQRKDNPFGTPRDVRLVRLVSEADGTARFAVELDAQGGEQGLDFTLVFDAQAWRWQGLVPGANARGAQVLWRASREGETRVLLLLPAGLRATGARQLLVFALQARQPNAAPDSVRLSELDLANDEARTLPVRFVRE